VLFLLVNVGSDSGRLGGHVGVVLHHEQVSDCQVLGGLFPLETPDVGTGQEVLGFKTQDQNLCKIKNEITLIGSRAVWKGTFDW